MSVLVSQDESRPEGGYAVLRFPEVSTELDSAHLLFQPLDEPLRDFAHWPRGRIQAIETRLRDGALEVVVGPDVVNAMPADTAVQITLDELDLKTECRWPALILQQQRRRRKLPEVAQPAIAEPVAPRVRRPPPPPPSRDTEPEEPETARPRTETTRIKVSEPDPPQAELLAEPIKETSSEPDISELPASLGLKLAGSNGPPAYEFADTNDLKLHGSTEPDEAKDEEGAVADQVVAKPEFGRNAPVPPVRSGFGTMLLPILVALLVGVAAGGFGYRYLFPAQIIVTKGGSTDGGSTDGGTTDVDSADRLLMEALDSVDTTPDGKPIFDISKDNWWGKAYADSQAGNFAEAAQGYRMAVRAALKNGCVPTLLEGLGGALQASETTRPDGTRLSRLLYSLSALAGDPEAFSRLADSYAASNPDYAQRLRERAHALSSALRDC